MRELAGNRAGESPRRKANELALASPLDAICNHVLSRPSAERSWRKGARGEVNVAIKLRKLPTEFRVLHSIPVGQNGADIDHMVIGPSGVYSLNTKNHRGRTIWITSEQIYVDGYECDYAKKALIEGHRASRLLSRSCGFFVEVIPVIVVIARKLIVDDEPRGFSIVTNHQIYDWLVQQPPRLPQAQSIVISSSASKRITWDC